VEKNNMNLFNEIQKRKAAVEEKNKEPDTFGKKINPYDYILQIIDKTDKYKYDGKNCPGFLLTLWFSHSTNAKIIDIVQDMNRLQFYLKDDIIYKYYFYEITKRMEVPQWVKKMKFHKDNDLEDEINKIQMEYNVSRREALQIQSHLRRIR
jgi:hypothetical protein